MTSRFSSERIMEFWTEQALAHGQEAGASWSDVRVMEMEVREIAKRLGHGMRVLDVGCANGFSTLQLARSAGINVRGIDYIPEMIEAARLNLAESKDIPQGQVEFDIGNILSLAEADQSFDAVVVIRVVINLENWQRQQQGLLECARVVRPGGLLLLSEATLQGLSRLNALRREWGLDDIPMPPFNFYLDEPKVAAHLEGSLELVEIVNFASTYFAATRVIKPLLAKLAGDFVNPADPLMEFNRWMSIAPAWGDYGTQKLLVFRKR